MQNLFTHKSNRLSNYAHMEVPNLPTSGTLPTVGVLKIKPLGARPKKISTMKIWFQSIHLLAMWHLLVTVHSMTSPFTGHYEITTLFCNHWPVCTSGTHFCHHVADYCNSKQWTGLVHCWQWHLRTAMSSFMATSIPLLKFKPLHFPNTSRLSTDFIKMPFTLLSTPHTRPFLAFSKLSRIFR